MEKLFTEKYNINITSKGVDGEHLYSKDLNLSWKQYGEGDLGVLLFHAFPLNKKIYATLKNIEIENTAFITFDLPGFGESPYQEQLEPKIESYATIGYELMKELGYQKYLVGGTSMGGYVSLAFEKLYPSTTRGIILIDTKDEADSPEGKQKRNTLIQQIQEQGIQPLLNTMPELLLGDTTLLKEPHKKQVVIDLIKEAHPKAVIQALQAMRDREDSKQLLEEYQKPGIIIVGEEDKITPPILAKEMNQRNPSLHLSIVPGSGHLPCIEKPNVFNNLLASFIRFLRDRYGM